MITVTELFTGVKNQDEENEINELLNVCNIVPIESNLAKMGGRIKNRYFESHGTGVIDSIIAGTVMVLEIPSASLNQKHYPMMDQLILP